MRHFAGLAALAVTLAIAGAYWLAGDMTSLRFDAPPPDRPAPGDTGGRADAPAGSDPRDAADFDFYVLSLSWSPTFCSSDAGARNREQCGTGKGFGWVVHGLWPQSEQGWPENCPTPEGPRVPGAIGRDIMDIMPGMGLVGHQWRKHGSCSGLGMRDYFKLVRQAYDKIDVPSEFTRVDSSLRTSPQAVEAAFVRGNPGLTRSAVAVTCDRDRIDEVRICLDRSLNFRPCSEVDNRSCRAAEISILPTRSTLNESPRKNP